MTFNPKHLSHLRTNGRDRAPARSMLKSIGFSDEDLAKPIIGIAHMWIETMPCNFNHRDLAAKVKEGIRAAGATPMEFNTVSISDGVTMGTEGMKMIHSRKREFINEPATPKVIPVQEMVGAQVAAPAPVPARPEIQKPEVILPLKPEPVIVQEKVEVAIPEKIVEAPIIEKAMPAISTAPVQEHVVSKPNKTRQVASLFDNAGVLAHQFDEQKSVADKIASDPQSSRVADAMHQLKIIDLKKAIGINEQFLFINELLEGSMQAYTETIEKLNNSSDITQAKQLLEPLHMKYNWNTSIVAYQKLMDLVERKVS